MAMVRNGSGGGGEERRGEEKRRVRLGGTGRTSW